MNQNPYYIVASRLNSISNNQVNNNEWNYKLNIGTTLPAGTQIQVINSYINKQGIAGDSIEFTNDINEKFQVGYTIPQQIMYQQKPERTAKDDRLLTAALEDPNGSLGLQTPEISTPLTNYYDCLVQHNPVHNEGLNLFTSSFTTNNIKGITINGENDYLNIVINGDQSTVIGTSMPIVFKDLIKMTAASTPYGNQVQSEFCRRYMSVIGVSYNVINNETIIVSSLGASKLTLDGGNYSGNNLTGNGGLFFTNIGSSIYRQCTGVAYINSFVNTKEDGDTLYKQTRVGKPLSSFEKPDAVPKLIDQVDGMNYQAGINSDLVCEEFRSHNADASRNTIWNSSQTSVSAYDFYRGSYSFYFSPSVMTYNFGTSILTSSPATKTSHFDFENYKYGPKNHDIRMNANGLTIVPTGKNRTRNTYTSGTCISNFYPYVDSYPMAEFPDRRDLSIPKPGQPAKFKDTNSPQVDYLRNGYSYDKSPMRCEIFTQHGMSMIQTGGPQNPFQPNIYQSGVNQGVSQYQSDLSTITSTTFLDRVVLSQSMIGGLIQREDSYPYVKRVLTINTHNIAGNEAKFLREGDVIYGNINKDYPQSAEVLARLFPQKEFRGTLDTSVESNNTVYSTGIIEIPMMINSINNEGTTNAVINDLSPITNLNITGAIFGSFTYTYCQDVPVNIADSSINTFKDYNPWILISLDDTELKVTVDSENWVNQNPQFIPQFSAKGAFSDLNGDSKIDSNANDQNIILEDGTSCRFNYFIDSMHDQKHLDYLKCVGEDYALNPNHDYNQNGYDGKQNGRVCSHPYFNYNATDSGKREDYMKDKRILINQRGNSKFGGIHPRRKFSNPSTQNGLTNFLGNFNEIPTANYLFGSTKNCSLGSMKPPANRNFSNGSQVVMSEPLDSSNNPQVANNGLESLASQLQTFDPDNANNSLKIKLIEEKAPTTIITGIFPISQIENPPVAQSNPLGIKNSDNLPNCASALGDYETYPYSCPSTDMIDTGGTNSPLCLVQLQAIVENYTDNRNDYVLRPLLSDINISISKGVYSITSFLDKFNSQIKDIDENDKEQLASINNFKTVRRFEPLNGLAVTGGQVSLVNDFNLETHNRTIFSTDETSEFVKNPLVIAVTTQVFNDLTRAWQCTGTPGGVASWIKAGENHTNSKLQDDVEILGGSYVWYNFRDLNYWAEFIDKYPDTIENIISDVELDDVVNYDTQFYFSKNRNLEDNPGTPWKYGARASLGFGDNGDSPISNNNDESLNNFYKIDGDVEAKIDKLRKFNSVKKGIYVGAPNFELVYNNDENVFSLSNLHYSYRNPTVDLVGETAYPDNSIDQPAILYKTLSQLVSPDLTINNVSYGMSSYIKDSLETPQDQISGVFIYNMAQTTSNSQGNFIDTNSVLVGRTFNDYFIDTKDAKVAWNSTFWSRLGFTYETFNTYTNNKLCSYYLNPTTEISNTENAIDQQNTYFSESYADKILSVKDELRQALCSLLNNNSEFNDVSTGVKDNYLPGVTTGSNFDIRAIPQVASSDGTTEGQNNTLVRQYNNGSISSTRSMSGGYVYFPLRLGNLNTFDGDVNYTAQNIHNPSDGYVYQSPLQGLTKITTKSGASVSIADQLVIDRPYEYLADVVPNYNPQSYWENTFSQPIVGTDYPVDYSMDNFAFNRYGLFSLPQESQFNLSNGVFRDRDFTLQGSMLLASQTTPILANSDNILATNLPTLTNQGFYIITSDIVKASNSIKGEDQLPILGTIPLSSLSSQDFITAFNSMPHVISQDIIINSFNIKILNPDLTSPVLQDNSTIVVRIDIPSGSNPLNLPTVEPKIRQEKEKLVKEIN